jgi:hypothetical protein
MEGQRRAEGPSARGSPSVVLLRLPLDIVGEVQAAVAQETVLITGRKDTITVDIPRLRVGLLGLRAAGGREQRSKILSRADAALQVASLSVRFRMAGGTVAMLGSAARPGLLSRLLGLAPLEVRLSGLVFVLRSYWR